MPAAELPRITALGIVAQSCTPLHLALAHDHFEAVELLATTDTVNMQSNVRLPSFRSPIPLSKFSLPHPHPLTRLCSKLLDSSLLLWRLQAYFTHLMRACL